MPLSDQTFTLATTPETLEATLRTLVGNKQTVTKIPNAPIITLISESVAYIFLMSNKDDGLRVRLLAEQSKIVNEVFLNQSARDAAISIINNPSQPNAGIQQKTARLAELLQERLASAPPTPTKNPSLGDLMSQPMPTPSASSLMRETVSSDRGAYAGVTLESFGIRKPLPDLSPKRPTLTPQSPSTASNNIGFGVRGRLIFFPLAIALNWKNLGKQSLAMPSAAIALILMIGGCLGAVSIVTSPLQRTAEASINPFALPLFYGFIASIFVLYFAFGGALWAIQRDAYAAWLQDSADSTLYNFKLDWLKGVMVFVIIIGCIWLGASFLGYFATKPTVLENAIVKISVPNTWKVDNIDTVRYCENEKDECLYVLSTTQSQVIVMRYDNWGIGEVEELGEEVHILGTTVSGEFIRQDIISIDGIKAIRNYFYIPAETGNPESDYGYHVFLLKDRYIYEITVYANSERFFEIESGKFERFLNTLDLKDVGQST